MYTDIAIAVVFKNNNNDKIKLKVFYLFIISVFNTI